MVVVYLILAHHDPDHLLRLVGALKDDNSIFLIHIDKKISLERFEAAFSTTHWTNLYFVEKQCVADWGSYGLVQATLNGLKVIHKKFKQADRVVLLSGQDYPIKPIMHIRKVFEDHPKTIFMECFKIPSKNWAYGGENRFPQYESHSKVLKLYGGSQWFSFPFPTIELIFSFLKANPHFINYFKQVAIPDESFFQTLLKNCGVKDVVNTWVNSPLHFIHWNGPHPRTLTIGNFAQIQKSTRLFARKFATNASADILKQIDLQLLAPKG